MGASTALAAAISDSAMILSGASPTSIRGAGKTGELLYEMGITAQKLVINRFDMKGAVLTKKGIRPGVSEIIDMTRIPLIGVIPEDSSLSDRPSFCGNEGKAAPGTVITATTK